MQSKEKTFCGIVAEGWIVVGYLVLMLCLVSGCNCAVPEPSPEIQEQAAGLTAFTKKIETQQDEILKSVKENDRSIKAVWTKLEALDLTLALLKPEPGKEVIKSAPEPPAKANTQQAPLKVATPGASQETLVELATRLYSRGVSTHMKTEEQLRAIDSQMQGVKSQPVQYQSRPAYSSDVGTICIGGQCYQVQRNGSVKRSRR